MAKKTASTASIPKRSPRLLWANLFCLLDTSSGASMTVRQMLQQLAGEGYEIRILGATIFDDPKGISRIKDRWPAVKTQRQQLVEIKDGALTHELFVTKNTFYNALTAHEQGQWHSYYLYVLDTFKPDLVWFYGGLPLDLLIPEEARARGIPSAFYLANEHYFNERWNRDIDLILTDSQATAERYKKRVGFVATPVGKFIDPDQFVAASHERRRLLFINPSWEKGVSVVVQLALLLEQRRPDIGLEVVEARGDWQAILKEVTQKIGQPRESLANVIVTPNTDDMRPIYARARVLLAPSLWWESSGRVLAEAMLNGIPALITNRGGMPEMIDDAGLAFDFPEACYKKPYKHLLSDAELQPLFEAVVAFYDDQALYDGYVERAYRVGREQHHISVSTRRLTRALSPLLNQRAGDKDFMTPLRRVHKHGLAVPANKPDLSKQASPPSVAANADSAQTQRIRFSPTPAAAAQSSAPQAPPQDALTPAPAQPAAAPTAASSQDNKATFDWQIKGKLIVLDNRAKLIRDGALDNLLATEAFSILAFDPASEVPQPEQYQGRDDIQVFPHVLLGDGQPATLHACLDPALSSTLEPLPPEQLPAHHRQGARVLTTLPISTIALDSIEGLETVDWLILDDLSDAFAILEHGTKTLESTLLLQARVAFQPTHQRQPSLAELQHWASRNGFRFYRFNDARYHSLFPDGSEARQQLASELQSLDTLFIPNPERLSALDDNRKQKLVFLLHSVFNAHDLAYQVMSQVNELLAKQYLRFVEGQTLPSSALKAAPSPQQPSRPKPSTSEPEITRTDSPGFFTTALEKLIATRSKGTTHIVQVGANDGRINDPLYELVMKHQDQTRIALIEPQTNVLPHLRQNYQSHPHADIINCAIGPETTLKLYRVKPAYYNVFIKRYLKDSPNYRVPSGFSSFDKAHVLKHISGNLPPNIREQDVIEALDVPASGLSTVLEGLDWERKRVDVLQIDTEGMDDTVLYQCDIEHLKPTLINFEHMHLGSDRYQKLCRWLAGLGYRFCQYNGTDTLATRTTGKQQSVPRKKLYTKDEALAYLSGPTLKDFGVELKPLKITSTREVIKKRDELYETSRKTLTRLLNDYHGATYSERFWEILLHYFYYLFLPDYLSRWNNGILNEQPEWSQIFARFPARDLYSGLRVQAIIGSDSPLIGEDIVLPESIADFAAMGEKQSLPKNREHYNKLFSYFEAKKKASNQYGIDIGSHSPEYWQTEWAKDGVEIIRLPPFLPDSHKPIDWEFRRQIANLDIESPIGEFKSFWSSVAICLPCEYVEDFTRLRDMAKQLLVGSQPEVVISTLMGEASPRMLAALLTEQGVPLHLQQHGGGYGEIPSHIASRIEVRIADRFFTWGWQDQTGKTQPGPPHRFDQLEQAFETFLKQTIKRDEVLVIGAHAPLVPTVLKGTDCDLENAESTLEHLNNLSENKRMSLVYRFRRQHGSSQEREKQLIVNLPGETRFDFQSRSIAEAYARAREVIIVSPFTTSKLECEHLGIPYDVIHQPSEEFMRIPCLIPEQYEP